MKTSAQEKTARQWNVGTIEPFKGVVACEEFHKPTPDNAEALYLAIGLPMSEVSAAVGVAVRTLRCYKASGPSFLPMPYPVQFALESLANASSRKHNRNIAKADRSRSAKARRT